MLGECHAHVIMDGKNYKEAVVNYEKFIAQKGNEKDEMTEFSASRVKELKEYLSQINGNTK